MALDLTDCQFQGPALPEPFVKLELDKELLRLKLLPKTTGAEGKELTEHWEVYRRKLRELAASGGSLRVRNHVIEPLQPLLGYSQIESSPEVKTREDLENGGAILSTDDGKAKLRVWTTSFNEDLYAPSKRGRAYRYSHLRVAQRVLLASGERIGLLTNGIQLLILISDPARPDSTVTIPLDPGWKRSRDVPDSFRLLLALASPKGVTALPDLVEKARLQQARVTKELRKQAREAVEYFIQEILDHPDNQKWFKAHADHHALARTLWREGLITIYRLLFVLKLEASDDAARSFSFASTSLWRNTFSPSMALARYAHDVLERGLETGTLLESGLRTLFRMFEQGLECTELIVKPLGGALFNINSTPTLAQLTWGERAVAWLLDRLLWTPQRRGEATRQRVHYGPLDVEDLGRVYEALLELEPGISEEPMCRLRRQKLEVVVPLAQGAKYRPAQAVAASDTTEDESEDLAEEEVEEEEQPSRGKKTKVEWIEAIQPGRFYLRVGLGRKATGSYYTPHSFVRFLVQETLGPQVAERSPHDDPNPLKILELKVLDPAMGSGHFLVEACRYLGDKLYEACRLCDDKALAAERRAEKANKADKEKALAEAADLRQRVVDLPDPDDELLKYLPSRSPEGEESGLSQQRAEALCRRLVATHCLYGVDKNPLAVELAKLALWLESHAEGMPLTFLDHRLVVGDSLTGPFWNKLIFRPGNPSEPIPNLFNQDLDKKLSKSLYEAIRYVRRLEATVGITVAEMREKEAVKANLDRALLPFRVATAAWSGGVMLGPEHCDDYAYADLLQTIANTGNMPVRIESEILCKMIARGLGIDEVPLASDELRSVVNTGTSIPALSFDLTFPEVFYPTGVPHGRQGFHAVLGNPPWDIPEANIFEVVSVLDPSMPRSKAKAMSIDETARAVLGKLGFASLMAQITHRTATNKITRMLNDPKNLSTGKTDIFCFFASRAFNCVRKEGYIGLIGPGSFHLTDATALARDAIIHNSRLRLLLNFDNIRRLFADLPQVVRFDVLVSVAHLEPTETFRAIFNAIDDQLLQRREFLEYPYALATSGGDPKEPLPAFEDAKDAAIFRTFSASSSTGTFLENGLLDFHQEINVSTFGPAFSMVRQEKDYTVADPRSAEAFAALLKNGHVLLYESKCFHQFDPLWSDSRGSKWDPWPTLACNLRATSSMGKALALRIGKRAQYFRAAVRASVGNKATIERSFAACILPPGASCVHSALIEKTPYLRTTSTALLYIAVGNTFIFDYQVRLRMAANITKGLIERCSWPRVSIQIPYLVHGSLRLSVPERTYESLWREQLGDTWREAGKKSFTWPVLLGDDERWAVRAAIDAVVADAYGLSREQYAHVLSTFSHSSYKKAPELCLARFDELKQIGLDAFTKKHDPYWDIPLNENLPQPVIELPLPEEPQGSLFAQLDEPKPKKRAQRSKK